MSCTSHISPSYLHKFHERTDRLLTVTTESALFDTLIPKDHAFRKLAEIIDWDTLLAPYVAYYSTTGASSNALERAIPAVTAVHAIMDNYAAHKTPEVKRWLARHPHWVFHFTPTSSSWMNAVEGFFAKLTRRRLKYGVFHSVAELQGAINRFVAEHNQSPQTLRLARRPDAIIAARNRGFQTLGVNPLAGAEGLQEDDPRQQNAP